MIEEKPYQRFALVEETSTDGWRLGTITGFVDQSWGDAFVEAPDGSRAGLVWVLDSSEFKMLQSADEKCWGVYQVAFPNRMADIGSLVENFRAVLPKLREAYDTSRGIKG